MKFMKGLFNWFNNLEEIAKVIILVFIVVVVGFFCFNSSGGIETRKDHELRWCLGEFDTPRCHVELEKRKEAAYLKETSAK